MISIKTQKEIDIMREGGKRLAEIMAKLEKMVAPGITTNELNRASEALIFEYKAEPAFKGYQGFPAALCVSVNSVIVHSAPSKYALKEGDIVSLDLGIKYKGFFADMAVTVAIGQVDDEIKRLIRITKKSLKLAIKKAKPGNTIGDIGNTVERFVEMQGFGVVRKLCGHGIGRKLHEEPQIPNYGKRHKGKEIKQGMVFALEPMVTVGDYRLKKSPDGFGFETKDGSLSAHFEHTIVINKNGPQVLTKRATEVK